MPRYYTEEHEWIEVEGDSATVGITDYAQDALGDIVFIESGGDNLTAIFSRGLVDAQIFVLDSKCAVKQTLTSTNKPRAPEDLARVLRQIFAAKQAGRVREAGYAVDPACGTPTRSRTACRAPGSRSTTPTPSAPAAAARASAEA